MLKRKKIGALALSIMLFISLFVSSDLSFADEITNAGATTENIAADANNEDISNDIAEDNSATTAADVSEGTDANPADSNDAAVKPDETKEEVGICIPGEDISNHIVAITNEMYIEGLDYDKF